MSGIPEIGQLVRVRERRYVVTDVRASRLARDARRPLDDAQHVVELASVEDDGYGEELKVVWEIEPGARPDDDRSLPEPDGFDPPERFDAFLDAVRWGAIASADVNRLQAPFRSGIAIEDFQLEPAARALRMPRANLLIADDVGLGKTIEAGLVVQELLLRHRARRVLVLCPSSLQIKWRDEMHEKFGLEFRIVDADLMRDLRRRRGPRVNPWGHHPRLITSFDYLKRARPLQLFRAQLPGPKDPRYPRRFDLLIVDEAHNLAPAGRGNYATDSDRTTMLREIAPHFEHRLFLSATPHNGYEESFGALLNLLDDQRFARGVRPDPVQLQAVMVRRLKDEPEIRTSWDGHPRFPVRRIVPIEVEYPEAERAMHADLQHYTKLVVDRSRRKGGGFAAEFVTKLLKKRLFSSPQAFVVTLDEHIRSVNARARSDSELAERALRRRVNELDEEFSDDEQFEESTSEALRQATHALAETRAEDHKLLHSLRERAATAAARPDARAQALIEWLKQAVKPGGTWTDTRVIVFTEYRATQKWLHDLLARHGFAAGDRVALLYGGMETERRESVKNAFQAHPEKAAVRILLATDAASEGIDLQNHCYQILHYEIPWNPMRLEQRNGRVDRRGQRAAEVLVHHFVPRGYEEGREDPQQPAAQLEGDLEFLARAVEKVETIRRDLGRVGSVIADQVEEAMLGGRRRLDTSFAERQGTESRRRITFQRKLAEDLRRLTSELHEARDELRLTPENILHVVQTGLALAERPALESVTVTRRDRDGKPQQVEAWRLPPLDGSWAACADGLAHPHTGEIRPLVFDPYLADGYDDVVYAHLNHRLVAMCLRLLRGEVWATARRRPLHRVTARIAPSAALQHPVVIGLGRIVVLGGDQRRIHEQVIAIGGRLEHGRFARLKVGEVEGALTVAGNEMPSEAIRRQFQELWPSVREPLARALDARMRDLADGLAKKLQERAAKEADDITHILEELARVIRVELDAVAPTQMELWADSEREQRERDRVDLRRRLGEIPAEIQHERDLIVQRYADCTPRLFPVAVSFIVPERLAR
jgi:superfamily II DNA/RNA helicase